MGPRLLTFAVRGDVSDSRQIESAVEQACANLTTPLDVAALLPDNLGKWPVSLPMAKWLATYPSLQLVVLDVAAGRGIAVLVHEGTPRRRFEIRAAAATFLDYWRELRR